ncbi:CPBP family intramembrane glutamic endopeptidase [Yoonia sp. I 8.24]|uniref:CPBP family intramembrane glutamic endopeptidase n=1 Tax=Yoonia sp. I 8.24 TaxID=1537229 RepID=UPI001EDF467A|nr:CPBP family intramembrane glutamic endopeptidase [Yoonia sp. I 8.24]MCG3267853.1 CPBP family intramembrane metalloprotease [Yoonia sp. I 8.24]
MRNIVIYVAGAYALSVLGCLLVAWGHDVGGLVFVVSAILMALSLRAFGGDGWKTAGFRPTFAGHAFDYALALLVFPALVALSLVLGAALGTLTLFDGFVALYLPAILAMLPITMLYAVFEEFGWRGYLEPQLEILGVPDLKRHLLVGLIWTIWHISYLMTFGNVADIPLYLFMPIYLIETLAMAVWYGVSRKRTNSVWPAVIAHGCANAIMWPLVMTADLVIIHNGLWISPRPDATLSMCLLIAVAAFVWRRR